jgi:hypothetical protein
MMKELIGSDLSSNGIPETQDKCCALAARVAMAVCGAPCDDYDFQCRARALAAGLFGPAYAEADRDQRSEWDDMCEIELRRAAGVAD